MAGLRERKRQRTHDVISAAAISLFLAEGFERVSVADVAAAAEVSKPTLFKYFATKEDLVLHRIADHRVNYKSHNLDQVLDGDLDAVVQALVDADTQAKLAAATG